MSTVLIIASVWIVVALGLHWHRKDYYRKNPYEWNQRGTGLIAFTDRQYWWMMTLWPLAIVLIIGFILMCWCCRAVEWLIDLKRT